MVIAQKVSLQGQVLRLLGYILNRPVADHENPSRSTEPSWDSLKHIELMFLLEDHFKIRLSEREMWGMEDALGIIRILEGRMPEKTERATETNRMGTNHAA